METLGHSNARRLQRKNIALTYPQTDGDKHELLAFLCNLLTQHEVKYAIVCKEEHQDGGKHFHCFIMLEEKLRITDMRMFDWMGNHPHIEETRSPREWINYVKKDGDWEEYGTNPLAKQRMERRERVQYFASHSMQECLDSGEFTIYELSRHGVFHQMLQNNTPQWPVFMKRQVLWLYGPAGTGKTRYAVEMANRYYRDSWVILSGNLQTFMIGYTGQRCVIIDDIRPGTMRFERLLHLTDGYRVYVNVKGGMQEWVAECVLITAPIRPEEMFVNRETREAWDGLDQLLRRIDEIREFPYQEPTAVELPALPDVGPHDVPWLPTEDPAESNGVETMESLCTLSPINLGLN